MFKLKPISALLALSCLGLAQPAQANNTIIYKTGDQAPGTASGAQFSTFSAPLLNSNSNVAFQANLRQGFGGVTSSNDAGIWRDNSMIARESGFAPGTSYFSGSFLISRQYAGFGNLTMNSSGQLAYIGVLSGSTTNNSGIWQENTLIARTGSQAGGLASGSLFNSLFFPVINNQGQVAYEGFLRQGGSVNLSNDNGLWRNSSLIAREDNSAPVSGGKFSYFNAPTLNNHGQTLFEGHLKVTGPVTSTNEEGLWRDGALIAREDQQAPGTPSGAKFSSFATDTLNNKGQVAYGARLRTGSGGVTSDNDNGLWRDNTLIAREGNRPGGTPTSTQFSSFGAPRLNDAGDVAYSAFLKTTTGDVTADNNSGLWRGSTLIAREGFQAPGTTDGTVFSSFFSPAMNNGGQLAYEAFLRTGSGDATSTNNNGLWLAGRYGDHLLVVREGDILNGKTVSVMSFNASPTSDSHGAGFNDYGQLAYSAGFTDGTTAVVVYTPDVHWGSSFSSSWSSRSNWTLGLDPAQVHDVMIDPTASVTVYGPTTDTTVKSLQIGGNNGVATLQLQYGATLTASNGTLIKDTGILSGDGSVTGAGAVQNNGEVHVNNLTLPNGLSNHGLVTGGGRLNARLTNHSDGIAEVENGGTLKLTGTQHTNQGRFQVENAQTVIKGSFNNDAGGRLILNDGGADFRNGLTNNGQVLVTFGESFVFGNIVNNDKMIFSGNSNTTIYDDLDNEGTAQICATCRVVFFGDVTGSGSFTGTGIKYFEGSFTPGSSPGVVTDDGNAVFGAGNTLQIEIAGETLGSEYDHYDVKGKLTLGGILDLVLLDDYLPEVGDSFDILDWGELDGIFSGIDTSAAILNAGLKWNFGSLYKTGTISVQAVPVPAAFWFMLSGLGLLAGRGRRH